MVLEHHSNLTPDEQSWRGKILAENWDAPVICTTSVQFLETCSGLVLAAPGACTNWPMPCSSSMKSRRLPVNCVHLFNNAINFLVDHAAAPSYSAPPHSRCSIRWIRRKVPSGFPNGNELMPDVKAPIR